MTEPLEAWGKFLDALKALLEREKVSWSRKYYKFDRITVFDVSDKLRCSVDDDDGDG